MKSGTKLICLPCWITEFWEWGQSSTGCQVVTMAWGKHHPHVHRVSQQFPFTKVINIEDTCLRCHTVKLNLNFHCYKVKLFSYFTLLLMTLKNCNPVSSVIKLKLRTVLPKLLIVSNSKLCSDWLMYHVSLATKCIKQLIQCFSWHKLSCKKCLRSKEWWTSDVYTYINILYKSNIFIDKLRTTNQRKYTYILFWKIINQMKTMRFAVS